MNIGIRAHDIESQTIEELTDTLDGKNIDSIQLALLKSIKEYDISTESLNVGFAKRIGRYFDNKNIDIAVLGCYINMIHPDEQERKKALNFFKAHIRYASAFGALTVGSETGGIYPEIKFTKDNYTEQAYQRVVESVAELVKEAEQHGVIVTIEGGINHPIYSPEVMKRLLVDIDSQNMQVIFDPVNYLFPEDSGILAQHKVIDEAFDLFGERINVLHAKDFITREDELEIVPVGQGEMDYDYLIKRLKERKPLVSVLLEETKEPHIDSSIDFLKSIYNKS